VTRGATEAPHEHARLPPFRHSSIRHSDIDSSFEFTTVWLTHFEIDRTSFYKVTYNTK
jgi:hypothetical protein